MKLELTEDLSQGVLTDAQVVDEILKLANKPYLAFDGINDQIAGIPLNGFPATTTSIYIAFWATPMTLGNVLNSWLQTQPYASTNNISILFPTNVGQLLWDFGNVAGAQAGRLGMTIDTAWLNVLAFYEFEAVIGSHMRIHRNLTQIAQKLTTSATGYTKGTNTISIGGVTAAFAKTNFLMMAILSATPSLEDRTLIKNKLLTGSESGLLIGYNFNEGSGTTVDDISPNGNDGTISGATWNTEPTMHKTSGSQESPEYDIAENGTGGYSRIDRVENIPSDTSILYETNLFIAGAWQGWQPHTSGNKITNFEGSALTGAKLKTRKTLTTNLLTATPSVSNVKLYAEDALEPFRAEFAHVGVLLDLDLIGGALYYTNLDVETYFLGNKYIPIAFQPSEFSNAEALTVDTLTIQFDNASLFPVGLFLNNDQRDRPATMYFAGCDKYGRVRHAIEIFRGFISSVRINPRYAEVTINHELAFWNRETLRSHDYATFKNLESIELKEIAWGREIKK